MSDPLYDFTRRSRRIRLANHIFSGLVLLLTIWLSVRFVTGPERAEAVRHYLASRFSNFVRPEVRAQVNRDLSGVYVYRYDVSTETSLRGIRDVVIHAHAKSDAFKTHGWLRLGSPVVIGQKGAAWRSNDGAIRSKPVRFALSSPGPPSIVEVQAGSSLPYEPYIGLTYEAYTPAARRVTGYTVGPGTAPDSVSLVADIETMVTTTQRMHQLGWITNPSFARQLSADFNEAAARCSEVQDKTCLDQLIRIRAKVHAPGVPLTTEAHGLLYWRVFAMENVVGETDMLTVARNFKRRPR